MRSLVVARLLSVGCLLLIGVGLVQPARADAVASSQETEEPAPAGADTGDVVDGTSGDDFDGRSTRDTVRFVVGALVAIAGATAVSLLIFIWHTSPRRRQRIADRRAERGRAEAED